MKTPRGPLRTGRQLRAARAMANLTQRQLAIEAGFAPRAGRWWEKRPDGLPTSVPTSQERIVAVLRRHGVELFADPTPGCYWRA